ncbi:MAG: EAL domain-containing protein [Betaproteobacteria bacterium]|nr:EAL domain-containing protein [Betaproteobacteria bacterium]
MNNIKIWVRLVVLVLLAGAAAVFGLIGWAIYEQRTIARAQAEDFANSVHQMTMAGLTGMMITGTMPYRNIFLDQIKETNNIASLKVIRSTAVRNQFGPGFEHEQASDAVEEQALVDGKKYFAEIENEGGGRKLRAVLPVIAQKEYLGKDCLNCHEVPVGTILGAVSMEIKLDKADRTVADFRREATLAAILLSLPTGLLIWLFVSRLVNRPLRRMTSGLRRIAEGDIEVSEPLPVSGRNEIGDAIDAFNKVMDKAHDLLRQQRLMRIVFENSLEGIAVTDPQTRFQMVNKAFSDTTGYPADEVIGQTPVLLKSGRQSDEFYREFWTALQQHGEWRGEIWNRRKNGSMYAEWLNVSAVRDPKGAIEHYVAIFSDITERKEREEQMAFRAFHDALTGLPNRILFRDRLEQAIAVARRNKARTPAIMFLDLDRFKEVNDTLGHDAGDTLLKAVASRLRNCVRNADTVARFAGDEFTVLLPEIGDEEDACMVADKILAAMQEPIELGGQSRVITTSIGIAMFPRDAQDAESLMKCADMAMYQVKGRGRADKCIFSPDLLGKPTRRAELESRLKDAFINREFEIHYQAIHDLRSGRVCGKEALLRWRTADGDVIPPEDFIGLAEECELMTRIGEWVLENACTQARLWQLEKQDVFVAVNLSATEFRRSDLLEMIHDIVRRTGLSPELLNIEVAEVLAMQDVARTARIFKELRAIGIQVSIDDFGTGFTGLPALGELAPDALKIDNSLVRDCTRDDRSRAIVGAVFGIATALDFRVVAEGVENEQQLDLLRAFACHQAQGYHLSPPEPLG